MSPKFNNIKKDSFFVKSGFFFTSGVMNGLKAWCTPAQLNRSDRGRIVSPHKRGFFSFTYKKKLKVAKSLRCNLPESHAWPL